MNESLVVGVWGARFLGQQTLVRSSVQEPAPAAFIQVR